MKKMLVMGIVLFAATILNASNSNREEAVTRKNHVIRRISDITIHQQRKGITSLEFSKIESYVQELHRINSDHPGLLDYDDLLVLERGEEVLIAEWKKNFIIDLRKYTLHDRAGHDDFPYVQIMQESKDNFDLMMTDLLNYFLFKSSSLSTKDAEMMKTVLMYSINFIEKIDKNTYEKEFKINIMLATLMNDRLFTLQNLQEITNVIDIGTLHYFSEKLRTINTEIVPRDYGVREMIGKLRLEIEK